MLVGILVDERTHLKEERLVLDGGIYSERRRHSNSLLAAFCHRSTSFLLSLRTSTEVPTKPSKRQVYSPLKDRLSRPNSKPLNYTPPDLQTKPNLSYSTFS